MIRSLLVLFALGVGGMIAFGLVTALVAPLFFLALKIAFVLIIGYLILRMLKPEKAEEIRSRFDIRPPCPLPPSVAARSRKWSRAPLRIRPGCVRRGAR